MSVCMRPFDLEIGAWLVLIEIPGLKPFVCVGKVPNVYTSGLVGSVDWPWWKQNKHPPSLRTRAKRLPSEQIGKIVNDRLIVKGACQGFH